jgi:hypothetical protein
MNRTSDTPRHASPRRAFLKPRNHRFDRLLLTLQVRLDPTVIPIANPPGDPETDPLGHGRPPEPDPLDASGHLGTSRDHALTPDT